VPEVRLLLADDHPVFLDGLALRIGFAPDLTVVATARSGEEAVALALQHRPDVAVLDIEMPGTDGIEVTRRLRDALPDVAVLVLTMYQADERVAAALRAGAMGYLSKHAEPEEIVAAVRAVARGQLLFGGSIAERIRERLTDVPSARPFPQLTAREHEMLDLAARQCDNETIARRLGISAKTVRNHLSNIRSKLPARDRTDAIRQAREAGLGR